MEGKNYHRMGRPPADWLQKLIQLNLDDDAFVDIYMIGNLLGISEKTVKSFCHKRNPASKYEIFNGRLHKLFRFQDIKKTAQEHIDSWV